MTPEDLLNKLKKAFPDWNIWRARTSADEAGMWMATLNRVLTTDEMYAGLAHTRAEDSGEELESELRAQAELRKKYEQAAAGS